MPLTFASAGSNNTTVSSATLVVSSVTAAVGTMLLLFVSADNNGASGAASLSDSVTDSAGNTWTLRLKTNYDPGAAAAGITLGMWTCNVTNALSNGSVTINFSPNTASKAAVIVRATPAAGAAVLFGSTGAGATGTSTTPSIATSSIPNGYTVFGATAIESNATPAADADTLNGNWSSAYVATANTGTVATSAVVSVQHKTVNAAGAQTYNHTITSADWAINWLSIYEQAQRVCTVT